LATYQREQIFHDSHAGEGINQIWKNISFELDFKAPGNSSKVAI